MKKILIVAVMCLAFGLTSACGIGDTNTTYERRDIGTQGQIEMGTIVDMMKIKTQGTQGMGGLAGGIAGGAAGSMIGGNTAVNIIGGVAGAVAGMVVGGMTEEALTEDVAIEFVVRKQNGNMITIVQSNELNLRIGDNVWLSTVSGTTRIRSRAN